MVGTTTRTGAVAEVNKVAMGMVAMADVTMVDTADMAEVIP